MNPETNNIHAVKFHVVHTWAPNVYLYPMRSSMWFIQGHPTHTFTPAKFHVVHTGAPNEHMC